MNTEVVLLLLQNTYDLSLVATKAKVDFAVQRSVCFETSGVSANRKREQRVADVVIRRKIVLTYMTVF